ncbi:heme ABC exporter ATP-binding protein CcmA [Pseudonocardia sp. MH-G8]|uniref:heme ABC exporter ATP-binding protein CcmA n=1 Tax=Pseudonocardia sp. MH-G8 TaxID=1854588 RepID=UPI000BA0D2A9|nr:heme ABC exporter ATP-binding protein CcmA [Pseudonocardia sp. MH-G8]OZM79966.1 heme ABC exporter ATP-binding protein CcmA [Pseudonocardia sp. MH-G8]
MPQSGLPTHRPADLGCADRESNGCLVRLDRVAVTLGRTPVLRDLDLRVGAGEALGVLGANGSGKTTFLHLLATLVRPTAGRAEILGREHGSPGAGAARPAIALIGHLPSLYPQLSLAENLRFVARLTGREDRAVDRALDTVGLGGAAQRRAERCSQGMQRRAELARVLLTRPALLLLDEIHAGLDRDAVGLVDDVVASVRGRGGACVLVSHEPDRLTGVVDRMVRINDGRAERVAGTSATTGRAS